MKAAYGITRIYMDSRQWITEPVTVFTEDPARAWRFDTGEAAREEMHSHRHFSPEGLHVMELPPLVAGNVTK